MVYEVKAYKKSVPVFGPLSEKFYSQFNNVSKVRGKYAHEMSTLHLMKTGCLPALLYGVETWLLNNTGRHKVSVACNNSFRHIFHSCWRDSVKHCNISVNCCQWLPNKPATVAFLA